MLEERDASRSGLCRAQLATSTTAHLSISCTGSARSICGALTQLLLTSTGGRLAHHIGLWLCTFGMTRQFAAQVKADKEREVRAGHDGTWVAHPALVGVALDIFNAGMPHPQPSGRLCSMEN